MHLALVYWCPHVHQDQTLCFCLSDYALVGHVMETTAVMKEIQCPFKCLAIDGCTSINYYPMASHSNGNRICELNNKTRQMKPGDFKKKKGSIYYGSAEVGVLFFGLIYIN